MDKPGLVYVDQVVCFEDCKVLDAEAEFFHGFPEMLQIPCSAYRGSTLGVSPKSTCRIGVVRAKRLLERKPGNQQRFFLAGA
ncbi:MAG: hypothetical protein D3909_11425 [Candidatus Electrothrix sp. ATG1]|nr:hypothetical protein [Candidatus Electrothrix sp. ATG1]